MRSKTNFCNIAVILLVLVSVGCAMRMYEGAAISPKKIAVIDTQATNLGLGYWMWPAIVSIDGKSTGKNPTWDSMRRFKRFEVLPGKHTLSVSVVSRHHSGRGQYELTPRHLSLEAKAGCVYCVKLLQKPGKKEWYPVIVEKTAQ